MLLYRQHFIRIFVSETNDPDKPKQPNPLKDQNNQDPKETTELNPNPKEDQKKPNPSLCLKKR